MITTVGGGSISTSALNRAIRDFGEQAKKRLDETGSLAGFEGKFNDDSSGGGSVSITISALGMAAYDASAGKDDTFLAYTLSTADPDGTDTGMSSGSSLTIRSDQDIDAFIAGFQKTASESRFSSYLVGPPDEVAAASAAMMAAPAEGTAPLAAGDGSEKQAASGASAALFDKLQRKQAASDQLVGLLQSFIDALNGKGKRDGNPAAVAQSADAGGDGESAIRSRLAQFAGTDVTT